MTALPLERTRYPGVYRRGARFVVVYRRGGRQRKESAASLAEARALKIARDAEAREHRRGPLLHGYALGWLDSYAGTGHDAVRENTRREYRRLLETFALSYFDRDIRVADLDLPAVQGFVDWLTSRPGRNGRLSDRSVANALTPLRAVLDAATAEGWFEKNPAAAAVLPRRRGGRSWSPKEGRYLTRAELGRLLAEIPDKWKPLFDLLAVTGLRISEAIALRWSDLELDSGSPRLRVNRAIVRGVVGAPKSRHGARTLPLPALLADTLRAMHPGPGHVDDLVFQARPGARADPGSLRRRVLVPAGERAGLSGVGFHALRHTCASMLIDSGLSILRLQRWMGHHSAAFTIEAYGHLLDGDLGPPLDLRRELPRDRERV